MNTVVDTGSGPVRGRVREQSLAFLGIPYAEAPVGEARFAPPRPRTPWREVRDCTRPPAIAPQGAEFAPGVGAVGTEQEDCLTLNVFTPAADGRARPVMFWVHGGAFTVGAAYTPLYDGQRLAEREDVVVVSASYRLGALGFAVFPEAAEAQGFTPNAGLCDLALALSWVRDNVAHFGGDAARVTLFGESAGGSLVTCLLVHPGAEGLFQRAIAQSAVDPTRLASRARGEAMTARLMETLGLPAGDLAALRAVPLAQLRAAQRTVESDPRHWPHFVPVVHGGTLPGAPAAVLARRPAPHVPLLIGYNRDEWNLFDAARVADWSKPLARAEAIAEVASHLPREARAGAEAAFDAYTESRTLRDLPADPRSVVRAIAGDARFRYGSVRLLEEHAARGAASYGYLFSYGSPALRGALGACHALDLPFVFGTLDAPNQDKFAGRGSDVEALSRAMMSAWASFARGDEPALPDGSVWPRYEPAHRMTVVFDRQVRVESDPFGEERPCAPAQS
jgi:para-nitrobenzyl esterase